MDQSQQNRWGRDCVLYEFLTSLKTCPVQHLNGDIEQASEQTTRLVEQKMGKSGEGWEKVKEFGKKRIIFASLSPLLVFRTRSAVSFPLRNFANDFSMNSSVAILVLNYESKWAHVDKDWGNILGGKSGIYFVMFLILRLNRLKRNSNPGGQKKQKKWLNRRRRNGREDFKKCQMKKRKRSKNWQSFKKRLELHTRFAKLPVDFFVTLCFSLYFLLLLLCFVFFGFDILLCIRKLRVTLYVVA